MSGDADRDALVITAVFTRLGGYLTETSRRSHCPERVDDETGRPCLKAQAGRHLSCASARYLIDSFTESCLPNKAHTPALGSEMSTPLSKQSDVPPSRGQIDFSVSPLVILVVAALMLIGCWLAWYILWRPFPVDSAIPRYAPVNGMSGTLVSVGSDTLTDVMELSSQGFREIYPNVIVHLEHKGSVTAPPALIEGRSQLAPMSRMMTADEIAIFEAKYGYKPTGYRIALDALDVYVNKHNPIRAMTLQQVDSIFSSTRKRGGPALETWGSLGLTGEWATKPITLYGRDKVSGTHDFFDEHVLQNGEFKSTVNEDISEGVVESVGNDTSGIGYGGMGWKTSRVRTLAIAERANAPVEPTYENSLSGSYPLARFLYLYVNQPPGKPLDGLAGEFIKYVLSYEGQELVVRAKFFPLPAKIVSETLSGKN
jgi:phosphate transport system substrate-binding protein